MSHDTHNAVRLSIVSTNSGLLDNLVGELPAEDADEVAKWTQNRTSDGPDLETDEERLTARAAFQDNGETYIPNTWDQTNHVSKEQSQ